MTIVSAAGFVSLMTGALFIFLEVLKDTNSTQSLYILMVVVYWPLFCLTSMALYTWRDCQFETKSKAFLLYLASPAWLILLHSCHVLDGCVCRYTHLILLCCLLSTILVAN